MYTISRGFAIQGKRHFLFVLDRLIVPILNRGQHLADLSFAQHVACTLVVVAGVGCRVESRREAWVVALSRVVKRVGELCVNVVVSSQLDSEV